MAAAPWVERLIRMLPHWRAFDTLAFCHSAGLSLTANWLAAVNERPSVRSSSAGEAEMVRASRLYYVDFVSPGAPGQP